MTGLFLTRNATPILSQFAAILGWLIERIFEWLPNHTESSWDNKDTLYVSSAIDISDKIESI